LKVPTPFIGTNLELVKTAKYLGVILDNKLTFKQHITTTAAKAQNCRHFLQRNLQKCSKEVRRGELINGFTVDRPHAFELPLIKAHYFNKSSLFCFLLNISQFHYLQSPLQPSVYTVLPPSLNF